MVIESHKVTHDIESHTGADRFRKSYRGFIKKYFFQTTISIITITIIIIIIKPVAVFVTPLWALVVLTNLL